jgi:hypothetical protein
VNVTPVAPFAKTAMLDVPGAPAASLAATNEKSSKFTDAVTCSAYPLAGERTALSAATYVHVAGAVVQSRPP